MRLAIRLALVNAQSGLGGPFGAVITKDGSLLSTGVNQVTRSSDPTAHAEMVAIRGACALLGTFQLEGCVVYCSCEPCPMCMGALYWARPAAVFFAGSRVEAASFGFDDAYIWEELAVPALQRRLPMASFLSEEASGPFQAWQHRLDRIDY